MSRLPSLMLLGSTALLLLVLGCGGRTAFEGDEQPVGVGPSTPSSTTSSGGSSGAAPIPAAGGSAGSSGPTGLDPAAATNCAAYCNTIVSGACPTMVSPECTQSCEATLSTQSTQCQKIGISRLYCLTTVYKSSNDCSIVGRLIDEKCALSFSVPQCIDPVPVLPATPLKCSASGTVGNGNCTLVGGCEDNTFYSVSCTSTSSNQSTCSCNSTGSDGTKKDSHFNLNEEAPYSCRDTLVACGFPQASIN